MGDGAFRNRNDDEGLTNSENTPRTVYLQATTGKLHLRDSCGITRRTRYNHFPVPYAGENLKLQHCASCWDGKLGPGWNDEEARNA